MKLIRFTLFLFYRYYESGRWEKAPHFHAVVATALFLWMNVMTILCFFDSEEFFFSGGTDLYLLKFISWFSVTSFILNYIGRKSVIEEYPCTYAQIKKGNALLLTYIILSFGLFIFSFSFISKKNVTAANIDFVQVWLDARLPECI